MPKFSKRSKKRLRTCHPDLQVLMFEAIKYIDLTIVCGRRGRTAQNEAFRNGYSTKTYPNSKHNSALSRAVDAVPYPIDWENIPRMRFFAGIIWGIAIKLKQAGLMKHCIRLGMDWDSDTELRDQRFNDYPHFEITTKRLY